MKISIILMSVLMSISILAGKQVENTKVEGASQDLSVKKSDKELLKKIINKFENLYTEKSSLAMVEMQINNKYFKRKLAMKMWSKGDDRSLIKVLYPKKDKGIATLKIDKEMYNYFPKINKTWKIPSSMLMGSWLGSDFTNDDLVRDSNYETDYNSKFLKPEKENYKIEFIPKKDKAIIWAKVIITVNKNNLLPIKVEFYNEKLKKVRIINFKNIKKFDEKELPSVMELIPLDKNKKENKTVLIFKKLKFNIELKNDFFSLKNLRNKR